MPDIVTNELYTEIDRLRLRVKELEEENRYLRAGCQDETHQCPIVGTNNTLIERIAELEAERDGYRNGQMQLQDTLSTVMDSNAKWAAENKRLCKRIAELEADAWILRGTRKRRRFIRHKSRSRSSNAS